jgi:subtilisin family serine protease
MQKQRTETTNVRVVLAVLVILVIVVAVVSLASVAAFVGVTSVMGEAKVTVDCRQVDVPQEAVPTMRHSLQDRILVTGPRTAVDRIVDGQDGGLVLEEYCDVSYRGPRREIAESSPFPPEALRDLKMGLYRVVDGRSVGDLLQAINEEGNDQYVFADPNYLTGLLGQSACSNPYEPELSPYEPELSPYEPELSGSECLGPAEEKLFWEQWAFEHIGVGPFFTEELAGTSIDPKGTGVRVGVFDSVPFEEPSDGRRETKEVVTSVSPQLNLDVLFPDMPTLLPAAPEPKNVGDHGLFVAGLIHAVAPESEIHLIRVVNEYGCGDLFTLNKALYEFIASVEKDRGSLDGVVLNLSLGIHKPRGSEVADIGEGLAQQAVEITIDEATTVWADETIESLRGAVLLAHSRGGVVVAAAGNESYLTYAPRSPQLPAAYPSVIGVAASNAQRERSCFSNWGDVLAPGGDDAWPTCRSASPEPTSPEGAGGEQEDCDSALISLSTIYPTGYAYWRGTSFSAPLVSGLAALVLDAGASERICGTDWVSPNRVFEAIRCGAPTGDGVINVPATLFRCIPDLP